MNGKDRVCPLQCGQCCDDYWRDVFDGWPEQQCPFLVADGCRLPRADRPTACRVYLCEVAEALFNGEISRERALALKADGYSFMPEKQADGQ